MNREIKFRGKDKENWHYGDLVREIRHNDNKLFDGTMIHIRNFEYKNGDYVGDIFPVNPETIGQYTGLKDEKGKEIYEGDIIEFYYDIFTGNFDTKVGKGTVEFIDGAFYIKPFKIENRIIEDVENEEWFLLYTVNIDTLEVIGDKYDNPELLGGE